VLLLTFVFEGWARSGSSASASAPWWSSSSLHALPQKAATDQPSINKVISLRLNSSVGNLIIVDGSV